MADSAADLDAHPHQAGGALQTAKDLFSGAAGGVAQVLLGKIGSFLWVEGTSSCVALRDLGS